MARGISWLWLGVGVSVSLWLAQPVWGQPGGQPEDRVSLSMDGGASVNAELLIPIVDRTIGIPAAEANAYFRSLRLSEEVDIAELNQYALELREDRQLTGTTTPTVTGTPSNTTSSEGTTVSSASSSSYLDVFKHPEEYRGLPVRLRGTVRRAVQFPAGPNPYGYETLYEAWVFPDEAEHNPAVVIFLEKPEPMTLAGDMAADIELTGYFFKMHGYRATDGIRQVPVFLAYDVGWYPPIAVQHNGPRTWQYVWLGILALFTLGWLWQMESRMLNASEVQRRMRRDTAWTDARSWRALWGKEPTVEPHH